MLNFAGDICEATARFQTNEYNLISSLSILLFEFALIPIVFGSVGLMASCASCVFFALDE
jgi:hypothetical protein